MEKIHTLMRPKTGVTKQEAIKYEDEFTPSNDIFYTSEIVQGEDAEGKTLNEFWILKTIGEGAYSKVKLVCRNFMEEGKEMSAYYGMKILHKPSLKKDRCPIY